MSYWLETPYTTLGSMKIKDIIALDLELGSRTVKSRQVRRLNNSDMIRSKTLNCGEVNHE